MDTLRAFDSAIRLRSFSAAGGEIGITHGAISRRIAELEALVGCSLFQRVARGVEPTTEALILHREVASALEQLGRGLAAIAGQPRRSAARVRVSVLPSFATRWLLPRLPDFYRLHPGTAVDMVADASLADLERGRFDFAIRYGFGGWEGVEAEILLTEDLVPVAAPRLLPGGTLLDSGIFAALAESPGLLHDSGREAWRAWIAATGWRPERLREAVFNDYNLVLEAAASGLGLAMGRSRLIERDLAEGRLVQAASLRIPNPRSYFLVRRGERIRSAAAQAFAAWIRQVP